MNTRLTILLTLALVLVALLGGALLWDHLPDPMASHWNAQDQVDGYISRFWGVTLMPLLALGMLGLFLLIPVIDPLKANIATFRPLYNLFIFLFTLFLLYLHTLTLLWNLGYQSFRMSMALLPALGLFFAFIGYLLRHARRNWFIGIRTPWTLSSDTVWEQTHRLGSNLFIAIGLLMLVSAFVGGEIAFWVTIVLLFVTAIFLVGYSYFLYQRQNQA